MSKYQSSHSCSFFSGARGTLPLIFFAAFRSILSYSQPGSDPMDENGENSEQWVTIIFFEYIPHTLSVELRADQ